MAAKVRRAWLSSDPPVSGTGQRRLLSLGDCFGRGDLLGGDVAARRDDEDVVAAGHAGAPSELVESPGESDRRASEQGKELHQPSTAFP
jgi:hypothetical protein